MEAHGAKEAGPALLNAVVSEEARWAPAGSVSRITNRAAGASLRTPGTVSPRRAGQLAAVAMETGAAATFAGLMVAVSPVYAVALLQTAVPPQSGRAANLACFSVITGPTCAFSVLRITRGTVAAVALVNAVGSEIARWTVLLAIKAHAPRLAIAFASLKAAGGRGNNWLASSV